MEISKSKYIVSIVVALVLGVLFGWLIWRTTIEEHETIRYVELPASTIYVEEPMPVKSEPIGMPIPHYDTTKVCEEVPDDTTKVCEEVRIIPDTLAIIADYLQRREYDLDFSTETTGTFKVWAVVEANRLASAKATIAPLQKEIERVVEAKPRPFRPFIGSGISIGKSGGNSIGVSVEVGALIKNKHLPKVGYLRLGNNNYITIGYGYFF